MKLIIGGAYQGKKEYAIREGLILPEEIVDGTAISAEELMTAKGISDFHLFLKRNKDIMRDYESFCETLLEKNPYLVIITNELGYGVVPMDKDDREWREATGRICCILAAHSDLVVRVACGLGMRLK